MAPLTIPDFSVAIAPCLSGVPEPEIFGLLGIGLPSFGVASRQRRPA